MSNRTKMYVKAERAATFRFQCLNSVVLMGSMPKYVTPSNLLTA